MKHLGFQREENLISASVVPHRGEGSGKGGGRGVREDMNSGSICAEEGGERGA